MKINVTCEEIDKINNVIKKLKDKYNTKVVGNDIQSINERKENVNNIIKDVLRIYNNEITSFNPSIFLTGSYSKSTCYNNSDINLNYAYDSKYKEDMIKYEQIINYIISKVLDIDITKINDSYLSLIDGDLDSKVDTIVINSPKEVIIFNNSLNYERDNSLERVYFNIKGEIISTNKEWAHTFTPLVGIKEFNEYYKELLKLEKHIIALCRINTRKGKINSKLNEINLKLEENKNLELYKDLEFELFSEFVSLLRDNAIYKEIGKWNYINYHDNKYLRISDSYWEMLTYMKLLYDKLDNNNLDNFKDIDKQLIKVNKTIKKETNE